MLKLFDYLEEVIATERISQLRNPPLLYTASEIMQELGYKDPAMIQEPLDRAMHACASLQIPVNYNFHKIFCFKDGGEMETDWQLSELATYLLMINCNPLNPLVAKAQLIFMMKDRV
ncbi:hypothetical protein HGH92_08000 [Chitinophaga varians]|uniref:Damage-inducible protein D n=1 Tax=Chitinophaga varians TaxID=2202339 RepID=A0A847RTR1_9BACT|nr:hypothetical protein [Chitinophaga varians]NLR64245.1 hypothetical protein [Chitinophaga varians]